MPSSLDAPSFLQRVLLVAGIAVLSVLGLLLLWYGFIYLLVIFAGILFAVFLNGLAHFLSERTRLPYKGAFMVVIVGLLLVLGGLVLLIGTSVASQVDTMTQSLPRAFNMLVERLREYEWGRWFLSKASESEQSLSLTEGGAMGALTGFLSSMMNALTYLLVALLLGFYLALHHATYYRGIQHLVPIKKRDRAGEVLGAVGHALRWWLIGRYASMALIGLLTTLGLWLLGVPLALTLGLLAALFCFVPYIGPIISFVPAFLMGFLESPRTAFYVLGLMLVIQFLESYMITPLVQQRAVSIPPALLLTAQLLMAAAAGVLGVLVATPLATAAIVLVQMLYVEDTLGDTSVKVLGT